MSKNKGLWGSKGWKRVNVADALLDTDEDGFVELEQLDGAYMGGPWHGCMRCEFFAVHLELSRSLHC